MKRGVNVYLCLLMVLALAGCASTKTTLLTGQGILAMGQTFEDTANAYNQLHDQGVISDEEYREWAKFARQFQAAYRPLVNVYKTYANDELGDPDLEYQVVRLLSTVNQELMVYLLKTRGR